MPQNSGKISPKFINTDTSYGDLQPDEAHYMCGLGWDINANPGTEIGTNNQSGEGQNVFALTPTRSNAVFDRIELPAGQNKNVGGFENAQLNEFYYLNFNSVGNHGIYVISGDTGDITTVIIDPKLSFTDNQEGFVANVRAAIRFVRDKDGNVTEKSLMWTDGKKWQGWVNVIAAIGSDGFNSALYPYWNLRQPHYDREELLEWPTRPIMERPVVIPIANTAADLGKQNRTIDKAFRFAVSTLNTDGRFTLLSPYSLPLTNKSEDFLNNSENLPKKFSIKVPAGSPLTERLVLWVQESESGNPIDPTAVWTDWKKYVSVDRFDTPATGMYWERQNQWADNSYDSVYNTIEIVFDNSRTGTIASQEEARMLQTGMPQISQALANVDDSVILCNNRYGYNNFSKSLIDKLSVEVLQRTVNICARPMRTIYLYAVVAQCCPDFSYTSQFGYINGDDKQVRFGGARSSTIGSQATIFTDEAKFFQLDFADRDAFRVYLKGTPYFSDGEWVVVKSDNSIEEIGEIYDIANPDIKTLIQNIYNDGSYFACRFKLTVPAGRYIATLGRHNVASSGDYRGTSTYIYGIANSRVKSQTTIGITNGRKVVSIKPNAIDATDPMYGYSKEMEIDCVNADVDVWGNNHDLFYVYAPYNTFTGGQGRFRFIEGYLKESQNSSLSVERFPYDMTRNNQDDGGKRTDKNGFYWAYTKAANSADTDIRFLAKVNCAYPTTFVIPTSQSGIGWKKNAEAYLATYNSGQVGDCNRIIINGSVKNLDGSIPYSNISISLKDGATVQTRIDGTFTLIAHNGEGNPQYLTSNVYLNSSGNYLITLANCGQVPLNVFNESLAPCSNCNIRTYPLPFNYRVDIQSLDNIKSLKQGWKYVVGIGGADLAGRLTHVNQIAEPEVSTFLQRDNINATYFRMLISGALNLLAENPDIKWLSPYVSRNTGVKKQLQWVGDSIIFLDTNGNETDDPSTASFAKFLIQSLYDANIASNLNLLASYQFLKNDRVRVYDDGDGNLFDTATFGDTIDLQILGTNYNQAAINAGLLAPQTNTILENTSESEGVGIIIKYDPRLNLLQDKTGFWIEIYTPSKTNEVIPLFETPGFFPVISGELAIFNGLDLNGQPQYLFPTQIDVEFWDTYYLQRTISGKFFNHPFESNNVTDEWGENILSGGRINTENKDAKQIWLGGDVIRSDGFMKNGNVNGLAMFRGSNRKNYGIYPRGEIIVAHTKGNDIIFVCNNDWFPVSYNTPYAKQGPGGQLIVTNLDENLSLPLEKKGRLFGIDKEDIGTFVSDDDEVYWYDRKNTAIVRCNFGAAVDITVKSESERGGLQSYINEKTSFINTWNNENGYDSRFDVIAGIDAEHGNIYFTFRPRRKGINDAYSYVKQRRGYYIDHQETFVYSSQFRGWLPCQNFTPEAYGRLRGKWANVEFLSFAAGKPYYHDNTPNNSFQNFYGILCEPVITLVGNQEKGVVKILEAISQLVNGSGFFFDLIYETQPNSFSYIPSNYLKEKEKVIYSETLRDMASYPPINPDELFRSMLQDGKRVFGEYFVCRLVQRFPDLGKYFQLSEVNYLYTNSHTTKP